MLWRNISGFGQGLFLDKAGGEGEPGSGGGGGGGGDSKPDISAHVEGLVAKHGDAKAALKVLYDENHGLREDRRLAREERDKLKERVEKGELLEGDDAEAWKKYQELGEPDEIQSGLQRKAELEQEEEKRSKREATDKAAKAQEWDPEVLIDLPGAKDAEYEVVEETVDGEKVEVAYITPAGEGAKKVKLSDHADEHWGKFIRSLEASGGEGTQEDGGGGQRYVRQRKRGEGSVDSSDTKAAAEKALQGRHMTPSKRKSA